MGISNSNPELKQLIASKYHHAAELYQQVLHSRMNQEESQLLTEALEELYVLIEALQQQNDELIKTRQIVEYERQRYRNLFNFAPDGYIVTDPTGKIEEVNQAAIYLLNVEEKFIVGKPLANFVAEENQRIFHSILAQLHIIHRLEEWELMLVKYPCQTFCAALTVAIVQDQNNEIKALRWLLRDISTRKQSEANLQQAQLQNLELIESDRLKSQFMATLSHELRTPMHAILGFSNLLQQHLHRRHAETHLIDMVERISRNSRAMFALIEDILDFSKLKAKCLELRIEPFDLVKLASSTVEELHSLADQKALELRMHSTAAEVWITNDQGRVRQILINLLSNAIKFTEAGYVALDIATSDQIVTISVSDTGIGIEPIHQANIFKEFWQVNQSLSRAQGGTGLGLTIVHNLVTLMQGSIAVKSQPGKGSTFQVNLPRQL